MEENEEIKEANEKYEEVVTDLGEINAAIRREMYYSDIASMRHDGKEEAQKEIAKNLLKENVDIEVIIRTTGLSKEEIEKLK